MIGTILIKKFLKPEMLFCLTLELLSWEFTELLVLSLILLIKNFSQHSLTMLDQSLAALILISSMIALALTLNDNLKPIRTEMGEQFVVLDHSVGAFDKWMVRLIINVVNQHILRF